MVFYRGSVSEERAHEMPLPKLFFYWDEHRKIAKEMAPKEGK